jgi:hypothetical protein
MEQAEWASDNIKTKKSEDGHVAMHVIETYWEVEEYLHNSLPRQ